MEEALNVFQNFSFPLPLIKPLGLSQVFTVDA